MISFIPDVHIQKIIVTVFNKLSENHIVLHKIKTHQLSKIFF
jgi:hypothetical protein